MSPRKKRTEEEKRLAQEMSEEEMYSVSGGISRLRVKCSVPGCDFECGRMTELNAHMKLVHPEKC